MKYATIYNRDYTRLEVPAVSALPLLVPFLGGGNCNCNHLALLVKKQAKCISKSKFYNFPRVRLLAINANLWSTNFQNGPSKWHFLAGFMECIWFYV